MSLIPCLGFSVDTEPVIYFSLSSPFVGQVQRHLRIELKSNKNFGKSFLSKARRGREMLENGEKVD
jgi:hypothetical protein